MRSENSQTSENQLKVQALNEERREQRFTQKANERKTVDMILELENFEETVSGQKVEESMVLRGRSLSTICGLPSNLEALNSLACRLSMRMRLVLRSMHGFRVRSRRQPLTLR